jgi:hypothetical protein
MSWRRAAGALTGASCASLLAFVGCRARPEATSALALSAVSAEQLHATLGTPRASPGAVFSIADPKLRATIPGSGGRAIELEFRYLGATAERAALRSGEERAQLGLELAARDTCNLVYVMWRLEPASELVVSVKQNEGASRHAECENRGYRRLRPDVAAPLPQLVPAGVHRLRGELASGRLCVFVDGARVWEGPLDPGARALSGQVGLRSDNVRFDALSLSADLPAGGAGH